MKIEIKNSNYTPRSINDLYEYLISFNDAETWIYCGLIVELDPTIDFKGNDALIRWTDNVEGFNDKLIVNSLEEFQNNFQLLR